MIRRPLTVSIVGLLALAAFLIAGWTESGRAQLASGSGASDGRIVFGGQAPDPGVYDDRIVFGQSAALEGPAAELGLEIREGIVAAFDEVNAAGGVHGRRLELISYDDGYEPETAIANTMQLIDEDQVFALIGAVGTPTSMATAPIAAEAGVPFIGPLTGAEFLRDATLDGVVNVRASYFQEAEQIVDWLVTDRDIRDIAVLYQDDSFGRAGLAGVRQALERRGLSTVSEGAYPRNTTAVRRALLAIRAGAPEAIIIAGAYQPTAAFIQWARLLDLDSIFVSLSFVGSQALAEALGPLPEGVEPDTYISQVVPPPDGDDVPILDRYRSAMLASNGQDEPSFVSLEGYIAGRLVTTVLESLDDAPTRDEFLTALSERGQFDIDGFTFDFSATDNQGSDSVFLTIIDDTGQVVSLDRAAP
ncbi:MAG: ABC transporter substrate-binding protein [Pseudomonadota bacterium]